MRHSASLLLAVLVAGLGTALPAAGEEAAWKEAAVVVPAHFSTDKLQHFTVSPGSSLVYGIDPQTLSVGEDQVVRYVLVARSTSGALNVLYEGVRCKTGETKTYARWDDNRSAWNEAQNPDWKALSLNGPTRHAMVLAKEGLCNGRAVNGDPRQMLTSLRAGPASPY